MVGVDDQVVFAQHSNGFAIFGDDRSLKAEVEHVADANSALARAVADNGHEMGKRWRGMESPSRWYEAQPGVLDPEQELTLINDADAAHVQYVLVCNRHVEEYGIAPFGVGYDRSING